VEGAVTGGVAVEADVGGGIMALGAVRDVVGWVWTTGDDGGTEVRDGREVLAGWDGL